MCCSFHRALPKPWWKQQCREIARLADWTVLGYIVVSVCEDPCIEFVTVTVPVPVTLSVTVTPV